MEKNVDKEKVQTMVSGSGLRRLSIVAAGLGLGAAIAYLISRAVASVRPDKFERGVPEHIVDDRGTGQEKAAHILRTLRDRAFEANDEKLALALGRPLAEVLAWNDGQDVIDDDAVMKARGIAMNRGIRVE